MSFDGWGNLAVWEFPKGASIQEILYSYSLDLFEIRKLSSVFLQVKTRIGLQMLYDREGLRLYLQADGRWKDNTIGLCGTFNGNMEDDFLYEYTNI